VSPQGYSYAAQFQRLAITSLGRVDHSVDDCNCISARNTLCDSETRVRRFNVDNPNI